MAVAGLVHVQGIPIVVQPTAICYNHFAPFPLFSPPPISPFSYAPSPLPPISLVSPPFLLHTAAQNCKEDVFFQGKYEVHSIVHVGYCWEKVDRFRYFNKIFSFEMKLKNVL